MVILCSLSFAHPLCFCRPPHLLFFFCCFLHRISSFQHGLSKSHQNVCTVAFGLLCAQLRLALNKAQRYINKCSIYKCAFFLVWCAPRNSLASNNNSTFYCSYLSLKLISRCCCLVPALSNCPCHVAESGVAWSGGGRREWGGRGKLSIILICSATAIHTGAERVTDVGDKWPTFIFWCRQRSFKERMHHYSAPSPSGLGSILKESKASCSHRWSPVLVRPGSKNKLRSKETHIYHQLSFLILRCSLSFSLFLSLFLSLHTHRHTHTVLFVLKELWVAWPAGRKSKEKRSCNRRRQGLFNIQLIWNLLVFPVLSCPRPAQPSQGIRSRPDENHFYWAFWEGQLPPCVCVCIFSECKPVGKPGKIWWDMAKGKSLQEGGGVKFRPV